MWVYTEYGEKYAKLHGHRDRKEGDKAMLGYKPVTGIVAKAWEKKGYIRWEAEMRDESESADG